MWKNIRPNYQVSNDGEVKSLERVTQFGKQRKLCKEKILHLNNHTQEKNSYLVVCINGKTEYVHILVAEAFISNPYNKPEVNHLDGVKSNNNDWNLEWVTKQEQMQHAWNNGLMKPINTIGVKNGRAILTEIQVLEIRKKYIPRKYTIQMLADEYGVSYGTIQSITLRIRWNHI